MPNFTGGQTLTAAELDRLQVLFRGAISGLVPSNSDGADGDDILFSAGVARDSSNTYNIIAGTAMVKQADATWAAGTNAGGMAHGVTWAQNDFHLFLLGDSSDETSYDFGFDTSLTAANLLADAAVIAAGFDIYRRVGSLRSSATPGWPGITALELPGGGLRVMFLVPFREFTEAVNSANAQTKTLTLPGGIRVLPIGAWYLFDDSSTSGRYLLVTQLDQTDTAASITATTVSVFNSGGDATAWVLNSVMTNTSAQVRYRLSDADADVTVRFYSHGWEDYRR